MDHAGTIYEAGFTAGMQGLPAEPNVYDDKLAQSIYLDGYADASREVMAVMVANLIPHAARRAEAM